MKQKKKKILVLAGGPSSEHDVSLESAKMVLNNLDQKKYIPSLCIIRKNGIWDFCTTKLVLSDALSYISSHFDFVFIAMHGSFGEDGRIQALLDWTGVPYSGSGVTSSALAMDKELSCSVYVASGLKTPHYGIVSKHDVVLPDNYPIVVKPVNGGSSVGISIVKNKKKFTAALSLAFSFDKKAMVQEYVAGREITCSVLEDINNHPFPLYPTEIIPKKSSFFDYDSKYMVGGSVEMTPAPLTASQTKKVQELALSAHVLFGCRGMSRSDFILKGSTFYILETNTIPGMTKTSLLPQQAEFMGISFTDLLDLLIVSGFNSSNGK